MPSPSLAEQVLAYLAPLQTLLLTSTTSELPVSTATLVAATQALDNIEAAARRRLAYTENERTRRASPAAGSVTAQGGPRD